MSSHSIPEEPRQYNPQCIKFLFSPNIFYGYSTPHIPPLGDDGQNINSDEEAAAGPEPVLEVPSQEIKKLIENDCYQEKLIEDLRIETEKLISMCSGPCR